MIEKKCLICNKSFIVIDTREHTAKYCSTKCQIESLKGALNCECKICKKRFHIKQSHISKKNGNCCSRECLSKYKKTLMLGKNNHQFGLKGNLNASFIGEKIYKNNHNLIDIFIYIPKHPYANKHGRVLEHRLLVEQNYKQFDFKYFEKIDNEIVLKKSIAIHHIDFDHNNNKIENLMPVTKSEHRIIHNANTIVNRNKITGRIIGVFKQGELLEKPVEVNQQPSSNSNILEGSTTNTRIQTDNAEDSNSDTSALPTKFSGDDIV